MTLRLIEGFDAMQSGDFTLHGWRAFQTGFSHGGTSGRRNTRAAFLSTTAEGAYKLLPGNYSKLTAGFALDRRPGGTAGLTHQIFGFYDGTPSGSNTTSQMAVRVNSTTGFLSVYRGNTLLATDNLALARSQFYYIEFQVEFHASAGTYELRVAGQTRLTGSGINTLTTANAYANHVAYGGYNTTLGGDTSSYQSYWDDFYVCDGSGSVNNSFLGDVRVDLVMPAAEGAFSDFTPSTGTDNALTIDELTISADYNTSNTVNQKDTFNMADLVSLADNSVYGVQPMVYAYTDEAGSRALAPLVRSGGANYEGTQLLLNTTPIYLSDIFEQNPDGNVPWTRASVNAAEFGYIVKI